MKEIGYVLSGCDQKVVPFVVKEGYKPVVNGYYFIRHPLSRGEFIPVLLRVFKVTPYNPEMGLGGFGPIAGKKGEKAQYGKGLEYEVAFAEALGYISKKGKWVRLECSPGTWDPVYQPEKEELQNFFAEITRGTTRECFPIRIGRLKGLDVPVYLDLNALARGHMFVAGMSVEYEEPLVYMYNGDLSVEEIGRFVDRFFPDGYLEGEVTVRNIYVPSFHPRTKIVKWLPVRSVIRHRYDGGLVRLELEDNRSVTVTPHHSVFAVKSGAIKTVKAGEVKSGDYLVAPRTIPSSGLEGELQDCLMKQGFSESNLYKKRRLRGEGDLAFLKVLKVEKVYSRNPFVYDLSVPGYENFVAGTGGVFCHNTRSGKSSFVISLIAKALKLEPPPRFLVFDRRCEYSGLTRFGAEVYPYQVFLPRTVMLKGSIIASRLNLDLKSSAGRLVAEAVESLKARGENVNRVNLLREATRLAPMLLSRNHSYTLNLIRWALDRRGGFLDETYESIDVVEACKKSNLVIVDLSVDTDVEAQQVAVRHIVSKIVNYALSRKDVGDFAIILVVEEAQYFTPERGLKIEVGNPEKIGVDKAFLEAVSQAGGYNVGLIFVTQRPAYISKSIVSQCNTIVCFRLMSGNDQEAIMKYTEYGSERMSDYLPGLANHEALLWGLSSLIPFPIVAEIEIEEHPRKARVTAREAWLRMSSSLRRRYVEASLE